MFLHHRITSTTKRDAEILSLAALNCVSFARGAAGKADEEGLQVEGAEEGVDHALWDC